MKTKKSTKKVSSKRVVSRKVSSPKVVNGMSMWVVAGILVVVLGGAYFIKTNLFQSPDIFEIGNSVETTNTFRDNFNDGKINVSKWTVMKSPKLVKVAETKVDNLAIKLDGGSGIKVPPATTVQGWIDGGVQYKGIVKKNAEVTYTADIRKLAGDTAATSTAGVRFDTIDGKYVSFDRAYRGNKHYIDLYSSATDIPFKSVEVGATNVLLRVDRSASTGQNQTFTFSYKVVTTDETVGWVKFFEKTTGQLSADGRVRLFATSKLDGNRYRDVVANFDSFSLSVEDGQGSYMLFSDGFVSTATPSAVTNTTAWAITSAGVAPRMVNGNLELLVPAVAASGPAKVARMALKQRLEKDKPATVYVTMYKPTSSEAGVVINELDDNNEARVTWDGDKLKFRVKGTNETGEVTLPSSVKNVQVFLRRVQDGYLAKYRIPGSEDNKFKMLGEIKGKVGLGNASQLYIFAKNAPGHAAGAGIFDGITLNYDN